MKKSFQCLRCGNCCMGDSTVSLSDFEIDNITAFLGLKKEEVLERYLLKKNGRIEMKVVEGYCIFHDRENKKCIIHPVKPAACKTWPLHPSILNDVDSFNVIKNSCIGLRDFDYLEICRIIKELT